uniref:Putative major epididymal secretory protein he1 n=1 Tax=Lutzomyia longipalpis TaxID=7200 RepID=A0A1B0C974_LUTLO
MFRIIILATVIPAIFATQGIERCNAGNEMPTQTTVIGCSSTPCEVRLGESARMEIIFTAPRNMEVLTPVTTAFLLGIAIPYELPLEIQRGCDHIVGATCPIAAGTTVTYIFEFPVNENYPQVRNLPVEVALHDQQGVFSCARVRIATVRG